MLRNRIFTILLVLTLAMPIAVNAEIFSEPLVNPALEETLSPLPSDTLEETIEELPPELNDPNSYAFKQPVSKKKIVKKFLLAMLGVTISSVVLFVLLSLYNKVRQTLIDGASAVQKFSVDNEETSLQTPESLAQAIKIFLDKTKWN